MINDIETEDKSVKAVERKAGHLEENVEKLGISILYVEDEDYIRNNMVASLRRRVETIYFASNGIDGLEQFKLYEPDLVITDIRMPGMDGLEMIKKIRKIKDKTKIIMLSAHSETKSLLEAIEIGVNGYMLKPFQTKQLYKLIEDLARSIILDKKVQVQSNKINELYTALMKDLETAGSVQEYLLPDYLIVEKDLFFSSTYVPSSKIGGDLYDIIKLSETEYISYIGDISGHGVKAALLMTAVKTTINRVIEDEKLHEPYLILNRLSSILTRELFNSEYMTLLLCYINCEKHYIKSLNAGHPPLIIYNKKNKSIIAHKPEGSIPIGWVPNYLYTPDEENEIHFDHDQILFLYTDGLFECENAAGEELGIKGLKTFLEENAGNHPAVALPLKIRDTLIENNYNISSDDFTLVAFSKLPAEGSTGSLSFFSGIIKTELSLIIKRAAEFTAKNLGNKEFAQAIEALTGDWIEKLIEFDDYYSEKETRYLSEICKTKTGGIQITIWSKTVNVRQANLLLESPSISNISAEGLQVELHGRKYDGFNEIIFRIHKEL